MTMDLREMNDVKIQLTNRSIMDQYINRYISLMLAQNFRSYIVATFTQYRHSSTKTCHFG